MAIQQQQTVIQQIVIRPPQRKTSDVGAWRNAMRAADNGRMKALFELFEDLLIDGVLSDAVDKRKDAICNSELTFLDKNGEEVTEITDLIDTLDFEELLRSLMDVRFWGRAGVEFDFTNGFSVYQIPHKHISLSNQTILINDTDESGISYTGDDNILVVGKHRNYGLFLKTAPFAIWKRGGFGDYAQWLEIFGMPQRVGKYSSYDPQSRQLLEDALSRAGSAPWVVIPKESDVETVNNTGSGSSGTSYNDFRKSCNEEMLIAVLGQTLTTIQGDKGARSLGDVHKEVEEGKNKADMRFIQRILNQYLLPVLEKRGYPVSGGYFVFPESAEELSVSELVQLSKIIDIPISYIYDKYSIPTASDGEDVAGKSQYNTPGADEPGKDGTPGEPGENEETKRKEKPKKTKLSFFANAPTKERGFSDHLITLSDSDDINDRIISRIDGTNTFDIELYEYTHAQLFKAVISHIKLSDSSFTYGHMDDAYKTSMDINLFHFSAAKTIAEITELNRLFREATSFDEFYKEAIKVTDVFNKKWMKTEYETAALVAESASNYWRLKKKVDLFPFWQYVAIMDGRTRESHANLHSIILPANDERWSKIMPPNGWKCRCRLKALMKHELPENYSFDNARKLVDEYLETSEWKSVEAQGWATNRAETAEVFTQTQQYINKFPQKGGKFLDDLTAQKWGLETVPKLKDRATADAPVTEQTAKEVWSDHSKDGNIKLNLFNNRKVTLTKENFDVHTTAKKDDRTIYFDALKETLQAPDELWLNNEKKIDRSVFRKWIIGDKKDTSIAKKLNYDNFNAIKFYKDEAIVANYRITNGELELRTWYRLYPKKKVWDKIRRGLFIKQKKE